MALGNKEIMGQNITRYMNKFGVDRKKLSADLGISYTTITDWIKGNTYPRIDKIELLANYFGVSKADLVEDSGSGIATGSQHTSQMNLASIYAQLTLSRQAKVYDFASYQLKEQQSKVSYLYGYISAGTGEFMEETQKEEISIPENAPAHDFVLKVNGDSMEPLFNNGEYIYIKATSEARDGQIIACMIDDEAFVKKLSGNRLVSLNKKYKDIEIHEYEDFKVFGVVVL